VKRGRQEEYIKDEEAFKQYLLRVGLEGAQLYSQAEAPPIKAEALETLALQYQKLQRALQKLSQRYPSAFLNQLLQIEPLIVIEGEKVDHSTVKVWQEAMEKTLNENTQSEYISYRLKYIKDEDSQRHYFELNIYSNGVEQKIFIPIEFFQSIEYAQVIDFYGKNKELLGENAFVQREEQKCFIQHLSEAFDFLLAQSKKGLVVQRYKGLGEMNPDQLWETTMDPETRRLLRVAIDDGIIADEMFTTLMGDKVEPRRAFIEKNALFVENIDV
jgi:DNA gyrase subunit B